MNGKFKLGDMVQKTKGSFWRGKVVGFYSTDLTPEGYAVESETEKGSVQIYPVGALEFVDGPSEIERLRQQNAELLVEMERIANVSERWEDCLVSQINEIARSAITKATGKPTAEGE